MGSLFQSGKLPRDRLQRSVAATDSPVDGGGKCQARGRRGRGSRQYLSWSTERDRWMCKHPRWASECVYDATRHLPLARLVRVVAEQLDASQGLEPLRFRRAKHTVPLRHTNHVNTVIPVIVGHSAVGKKLLHELRRKNYGDWTVRLRVEGQRSTQSHRRDVWRKPSSRAARSRRMRTTVLLLTLFCFTATDLG